MTKKNDIQKRMAGLEDDELLELVTRHRKDYSEEALAAAEDEILRRGGLETLSRYSEEQEAVLEKKRNAFDARITAVRNTYRFRDHVPGRGQVSTGCCPIDK